MCVKTVKFMSFVPELKAIFFNVQHTKHRYAAYQVKKYV